MKLEEPNDVILRDKHEATELHQPPPYSSPRKWKK